MADEVAQTYIDDVTKVKKDVAKIEVNVGTDKLTGPLTIKGFHEITSIKLEGHELTNLVIEDCPKLTQVHIKDNKLLKEVNFEKAEVNSSGEGVPNKIERFLFSCGKNGVDLLNLKNCKGLKTLDITDCGEVKKVKGAEDFDKSIQVINVGGTSGVSFTTTDELKDLKEIKDAVKAILGDGSGNKVSLPRKGTGIVDVDKLKENLSDRASGTKGTQLLTEINDIGLGLTGSDITKDKIIAKLNKLKQQAVQAVNDLINKINGLGLGLTGADITEQKVLDKITELITKPTCSHTDYDKIKAERDKYKNDAVKKEDMVKNDKIVFGKLGIPLADYEKRIVNVKASDVEKIRNELVEKRFGELSNQNDSSFYLNIGLGVVVVGSLAAIIWLLLRENKPKTEPELEKESP